MAKVVRVHQPGGPEALRIEELEVGDPKAGEARVRYLHVAPAYVSALAGLTLLLVVWLTFAAG